jgi:hypothetical protein
MTGCPMRFRISLELNFSDMKDLHGAVRVSSRQGRTRANNIATQLDRKT